MHIQDAKMPKKTWDTLVNLHSTNTTVQKMQLKEELHNVQRNKININEYFTKVNGLAYSLGSIRALIDDKDLVSMTLNGLGKEYC